MIYLASPYSHPNSEVKRMRFRAACVATAALVAKGHFVFSPIAHTHPIKVISGLGGEWDVWKEYDENFIARSDKVMVLTIAGWDQSVGVKAEIEYAEDCMIEVEYISPFSVGLCISYPYVKTVHQMKVEL